jgi:Tfp pilus assembly protein PilE
MKMKKLQQGFSAVEGLLIVIIIGMLGGVGYYVWHSQKQVDKTYSQTANGTAVPTTKKTSSSSATKSNPGYLVIKEWSVKIKLNAQNFDTNYRFEKPDNSWVFLSSTRLDTATQNSKICKEASASVSLNRSKPGDDNFGSPWTETELQKIGKKVGDYYYYNQGGQPCFGTEEDLAKEATVMQNIGKLRAELPSYKEVESVN